MEPKKTAVALAFSLGDDLRFLSHRETMRLWQRALIRTQVPLNYSGGFNPHPRMNLPLPRGVGVASEEELLIFEMTGMIPLDPVKELLRRQMPEGIRLGDLSYMPTTTRLLVEDVAYRLRLSALVDLAALSARLGEFWQAERWMVQREAHGHHPRRQVNLKTYVTQGDLCDENLLVTLRMTEEGSCRLEELMTVLNIHDVGQVMDITRLTTRYRLKIGPGASEEVVKGRDLFPRLGTEPWPSTDHTQYNERG